MPQNREGTGFAAMDPDRQREIASMGGRASHESGRGHEWDSREAREAGRLGGLAAHHHLNAAFHHDTAAHHHRQAAKHYNAGASDEGDLHAEAARGHTRSASEHGDEARRHARGFAAMDPDRQREIASEGGRARWSAREEQGMDDQDRGMRGGSREQHAEAGRRGAEVRWGREDQGGRFSH